MAVSPSGVVPISPASTINVTVQVANTGKVDGTALVQVYLTVRVPQLVRYENVLAGWAKVAVPAGGSVSALVSIKESDMDRWDPSVRVNIGGVDLSGDWVIDAGNYTLSAGLCWSSNGLYATEKELFPCKQLSQTVTLAAM